MSIAIKILAVCALIGAGIAWKVYAYHDCKHVGHSTLYCIVSIGK